MSWLLFYLFKQYLNVNIIYLSGDNVKLSKILLTLILFIGVLIGLKKDLNFRTLFYDKVYNENFNFAYFNKLYTQYFGSPMPFFIDSTETVFNEKLVYTSLDEYYDGIVLDVDSNYLIPVLSEGMVVFVGEKEYYGNSIIIEDASGVEILYGNLNTFNLQMYDYVEKGTLVGEVDKQLYLVFSKDGEKIGYEVYLE